MIKQKCPHEWEKHTNSSERLEAGTISATFICQKCHTVMTASEVFQLEALDNQTKALINQTKIAEHELGFQKWLSIAALAVSIIAIIVATLKS